ncbi:MAG TPA: hypothetical protein VGR38_01550, partial [Candidatus Polarisedimenticolia bacterium]|nr:hypothetical protein [Candidatus Polarisedimenticolia bacterium]
LHNAGGTLAIQPVDYLFAIWYIFAAASIAYVRWDQIVIPARIVPRVWSRLAAAFPATRAVSGCQGEPFLRYL